MLPEYYRLTAAFATTLAAFEADDGIEAERSPND